MAPADMQGVNTEVVTMPNLKMTLLAKEQQVQRDAGVVLGGTKACIT